MKLVTRIVARDQLAGVAELERQLNTMMALVDDFYALLGPRRWVFPDNLSTTELTELELTRILGHGLL